MNFWFSLRKIFYGLQRNILPKSANGFWLGEVKIISLCSIRDLCDVFKKKSLF